MAKARRTTKRKALVGWPLGLTLPEDVLTTTRLFHQAYNAYEKHGAEIFRPFRLTSSQVELLMTLAYAQRPMTLTELSPFLPIETASVSLVINRLHKRKIVQRRHSRADRRNIFITLTPQGKEIVDKLWPSMHDLIIETFFKNLSTHERQLFMSMLRKIRDSKINSPETAAGSPPDKEIHGDTPSS